jgi:hypothetical protein
MSNVSLHEKITKNLNNMTTIGQNMMLVNSSFRNAKIIYNDSREH